MSKALLRAARAASALVAIAGCVGVPQVGEEQQPVATAAELARRVTERVGAVESFNDMDAEVGRGLVFIPAKIFLKTGGCLRLQVVRQAVGDDLARAIINGRDFLFLDCRAQKAFAGEAGVAFRKFLPDLALSIEQLSPMKLFFPSFDLDSGESAALVRRGPNYLVEVWRPDTGPKLRMEVDAWSLAPVSARIFAGGEPLIDFTWGRLWWDAEARVVLPRQVGIRIPRIGRTFTLRTHRPRVNREIRDSAFGMRVPPGFEVETIGAEGEGGRDAGQGE